MKAGKVGEGAVPLLAPPEEEEEEEEEDEEEEEEEDDAAKHQATTQRCVRPCSKRAERTISPAPPFPAAAPGEEEERARRTLTRAVALRFLPNRHEYRPTARPRIIESNTMPRAKHSSPPSVRISPTLPVQAVRGLGRMASSMP